jgi:hypothetical protein
MNKRQACAWVHAQLVVGEMPTDELDAAFTVLVGRVPASADRRDGLYRRCWDIVTSLTGVSDRHRAATARPAQSRGK